MREKRKALTRAEYLRLSGAGLLAAIAALSAAPGCDSREPGKKSCADCSIRKGYDRDPTSLTGRLWKWHIQYCPGWKMYVSSLPENERKMIEEKYR